MMIEFEKTHGNPLSVLSVFQQVLRRPVADSNKYLQQFKDWVNTHPLEELLTPAELEAIKPTSEAPPQPTSASPQATSPSGEPNGETTTTEIGPKPEDIEATKSSWIQSIENETAFVREFVALRVQFESKIKCSYFDFKPLDDGQLAAWRRYLEFEESSSSPWPSRVGRLYERCLIPCANYVEFWLRYAYFLEKESKEKAIAVLVRASAGPLKRNPDVFIALALLNEAIGDLDLARKAYNKSQTLQPALAQLYIAKANFERRHNGYSSCVQTLKTGIENAESDPKAVVALCIKSAQIHFAQSRKSELSDSERAEARNQGVADLQRATQVSPASAEAWRDLLEVHCESDPTGQPAQDVFESISSNPDIEDGARYNIWVFYLNKVESTCSEVSWLRKLETRFLCAFPNGLPSPQSSSPASKRGREEAVSEEPAKRAKIASDESAAAMAQYQAWGHTGAFGAVSAPVYPPASVATATAPAVQDPAAAAAAAAAVAASTPSLTAVVRGSLTVRAEVEVLVAAQKDHVRHLIAAAAACSVDRVHVEASDDKCDNDDDSNKDGDGDRSDLVVKFVVTADSVEKAGDTLERLLDTVSQPVPKQATPTKSSKQQHQLQQAPSSPSPATSSAPTSAAKEPAFVPAPFQRDAWTLFRSLCKSSIEHQEANGTNSSNKSNSVDSLMIRARSLNLELLLVMLRKAGPRFCAHEKFLQGARSNLTSSLLVNAGSVNATVFSLSVDIFALILTKFRDKLKFEIEVFVKEMFLRILDSPNALYEQRLYILQAINTFVADPQLVVDLFVNYDCGLESVDIFESMASVCAKYACSNHVNEFGYTAQQDLKLRVMGFRALVGIAHSLRSWIDHTDPQQEIPRTQAAAIGVQEDSTPAAETAGGDAVGDGETERGASSSMNMLMSKEKKLERQRAVEKFNKGAKNAIDLAVAAGFIDEKTPQSVADFLRTTPGLDKTAIGEYIGRHSEFNVSVMHRFIEGCNFAKMPFDASLRLLLSSFWLPGEAQVVDRIMEKFGEVFCSQNPGIFNSSDTAFVLAFSTIMLNTDLHSPHIKKKMTKQQFLTTNRGINRTPEGVECDLDSAFLSAIYDCIQKEQIKVTNDPGSTTSVAGLSPHDMAAGNLRHRESLFEKESEDMVKRSQEVIKRLNKSRKHGHHGSGVDDFVVARDVEHVGPMFSACWHSMLAAFSLMFEQTEDLEIIELALIGLKSAVSIASRFFLATERTAFVSSLTKFTVLHTPFKEIKHKNVLAIRAVISIAHTEGNYLLESWHDILSIVSHVERLYSIAAGQHGEAEFALSPPASPSSTTSTTTTAATTTSIFNTATTVSSSNSGATVISSPKSRLSTSLMMPHLPGKLDVNESFQRSIKSLNQVGLNMVKSLANLTRDAQHSPPPGGFKYDDHRTVEENNALHVTCMIPSSDLDDLFPQSEKMSNDAVEYFVRALCNVSVDELAAPQPRILCLQKIVEASYYNMNRIRIVWRRIWDILGKHFIQAACHQNHKVGVYAVDSLRQLAAKFLEKEELGNYQFQKEFLKPFEVIMAENKGTEIREMVLGCIRNMVLGRANTLRSGWRTVFIICTLAARDHVATIVNQGFEIVATILASDRFCEHDSVYDYFVDCAKSLVVFASNQSTAAQDSLVSLKSIELLRFCASQLAQGSLRDYIVFSRATTSTISSTPMASASAATAATPATPFLSSGSHGLESPFVSAHHTSRSPESSWHAAADVEHVTDPLQRHWLPIFTGLSKLITDDPRTPVRTSALQNLFDILNAYGGDFPAQFWGLIFDGVLYPIFDELEFLNCGLDEASQEKDRVWLQTTCFAALRSLVGLFNAFFPVLSFLLPEFLNLLTKCVLLVSETLSRMAFACLSEIISHNGHQLGDDLWTRVCEWCSVLFEKNLPFEIQRPAVSRMLSTDSRHHHSLSASESPSPQYAHPSSSSPHSPNVHPPPLLLAKPIVFVFPQAVPRSPKRSTTTNDAQAIAAIEAEFDRVRCKCLIQLEIVQVAADICIHFSPELSSSQLTQLLDFLQHSFEYAHAFNANVEYRIAMQRAGLLKNFPSQLPSLLKQEVNALSICIQTCQQLCVNHPDHPFAATAETRLISLCESTMLTFIEKEALVALPLAPQSVDHDIVTAEKHRELVAWIPIVLMIIRMFDEFDGPRLVAHLPRFVRLFFALVACESRELREELRTFLLKYHDQTMAIHLMAVSVALGVPYTAGATIPPASINAAPKSNILRNRDIVAQIMVANQPSGTEGTLQTQVSILDTTNANEQSQFHQRQSSDDLDSQQPQQVSQIQTEQTPESNFADHTIQHDHQTIATTPSENLIQHHDKQVQYRSDTHQTDQIPSQDAVAQHHTQVTAILEPQLRGEYTPDDTQVASGASQSPPQPLSSSHDDSLPGSEPQPADDDHTFVFVASANNPSGGGTSSTHVEAPSSTDHQLDTTSTTTDNSSTGETRIAFGEIHDTFYTGPADSTQSTTTAPPTTATNNATHDPSPTSTTAFDNLQGAENFTSNLNPTLTFSNQFISLATTDPVANNPPSDDMASFLSDSLQFLSNLEQDSAFALPSLSATTTTTTTAPTSFDFLGLETPPTNRSLVATTTTTIPTPMTMVAPKDYHLQEILARDEPEVD
eukprot:c12820_g2_i2.p1 GENE.c12820_g2_i2~~c12820_g2_i2.p1  ORF type:complete len:2623 (+),score=547.95 c12820_g2_i2:972-8840(+)